MNKPYFKAIYCGVLMALLTATFVSCGYDDDEIKNRITVLEGVYDDIKAQLSNALTTGASVTNVAQDATGAYTLTLSDGQVIKLGAGGGSAITVTVTDTEAIIVVDGTEYKLPLGANVSSFVYSPEYVDGIVQLGKNGAVVSFLARPALADIAGAEFTIAESHILKTRAADGEEFKVNGEVTLDGDFIRVPIKPLDVEAGRQYAISLQMNYKGTVIGSNYFTVKIDDDYSFTAEELVTPSFSAAITDAKAIADGFYTATLPDGTGATPNFLSTFDFKDFVTVSGGTATVYELAPASKQNQNVQAHYKILKSSLASDGIWTLKGRPGTNCSGDDAQPGLLVYLKQDDVIKAKIYWKIVDPLASADFTGNLKGGGAPHMEYGTPTAEGLGQGEGTPIILEPGANKLDLNAVLMKGQLALCHGNAAEFIGKYKEYSAEMNGETLAYSDGSRLIAGDIAKKYATHSKGISWYNMQTSMVASQRRNWTMDEAAMKEFAGSDCNGEIIGGWDGLTGDDMTKYGLSISDDGYLITTSTYGGWGLRVGYGIQFEYDYGTKNISDGVLVYLWINRRNCAEGVKDLAPR